MSATHLTDEQARALEDKYSAPGTGSIARRCIRRLLSGIIAVGPAGRAEPHAPPTPASVAAADAEAVADELRAIDRRIRDIDHMLATPARPSVWGGTSYESQEAASEKRCLVALRAEVEADLVAPITHDRDGKPLGVRERMIRKQRAASLRESCWSQSEMYRAQGMHRESRRWRLDALRARHLAEAEMGWRPGLSTYL